MHKSLEFRRTSNDIIRNACENHWNSYGHPVRTCENEMDSYGHLVRSCESHTISYDNRCSEPKPVMAVLRASAPGPVIAGLQRLVKHGAAVVASTATRLCETSRGAVTVQL